MLSKKGRASESVLNGNSAFGFSGSVLLPAPLRFAYLRFANHLFVLSLPLDGTIDAVGDYLLGFHFVAVYPGDLLFSRQPSGGYGTGMG